LRLRPSARLASVSIMPDERPFKLDLDTERRLVDCIDHDLDMGTFQLQHDRVFVLDAHSGDPGRSELIGDLETKLGLADAGGVKLLELDIRGSRARFALVPRWDLPPAGMRGLGGPSIGLRFTPHW
jgi:hypothetical protein